MAKKNATRQRKTQSKVVKAAEEEDSVNNDGQTETVLSTEQTHETKEDNATESMETEMKQEDQNEQDLQKNTVIEVKGNTPTVTVSWEKEREEGEGDDTEKTSDQMAVKEEMAGEDHTEIISSADTVVSTEEAPSQTAGTKMDECGEKQESQMDTVSEDNQSTPTVAVTRKNEDEEGSDADKETDGSEQMTVTETVVNGKRKADTATETSPSKKAKLINDDFCLFVGNLNKTKTFEEVKNSLANYLIKQSLLFQDIRLDRSRKYAYVDLASEIDLTKALTLNGEVILDKPMRIAKAKIKSVDKVKVKAPSVNKKAAKDAKCLFLKNVPYNTTKKDILKCFPKAIDIRFPGGAEGPRHGIAFLEFEDKAIANRVLKKKQGAKMQDRVLIVDSVGEKKVSKTNADTKVAAPPNNTLFVSNLSPKVKEKKLKSVFQKAVSISIPQSNGKRKGFAFVEFATVVDAEKALKASQNVVIHKKAAKVQFSHLRMKPEETKVLLKTLVVMSLAEKTTAETLQNAFEGTLSARVIMDKEKGVSKRFGFVEFESEEKCKAAKEAMEDCEIDGSKVTVAYAKAKAERGPQNVKGGCEECLGKQSASPGAGKRGKGRKSKRGKGPGSGTPQDAVKEVKSNN